MVQKILKTKKTIQEFSLIKKNNIPQQSASLLNDPLIQAFLPIILQKLQQTQQQPKQKALTYREYVKSLEGQRGVA